MFLLVENLANELVRLGATKLIQELLEAQVTEALGRAPYERRGENTQGYRNGYKQRRLDTAEGRRRWRRRCATGRGARSRHSG